MTVNTLKIHDYFSNMIKLFIIIKKKLAKIKIL